MTDNFILKCKKREATGRRKVSQLRKNKLTPAVVYGSGSENTPIEIETGVLIKAYEQTGESSIIDLVIDENDPINVIIKDVQRDPLTDEIAHLDFHQVRMDQVIRSEVELVFIGEAPAVRNLGGTLVKNITEIEVECLPAVLPSEIEVDISTLKTFDDTIRVHDIIVEQGVTILLTPEQTVVSVAEPRSDEELKALEEDVVEDVDSVASESGEKEDDDESGEKEDGKKPEEKENS